GRQLDLTAYLAAFREALARPAVRAALTRATYQQPARGAAATPVHAGPRVRRPRWVVHRERSFALREGDILLSGQMDRLVVLHDADRVVGADVLDFKTDTLSVGDAEAISARTEIYRPQLEAYRRAAAQWLGLPRERVSARLVFLGPGVVVEV
ncbi:MAG: PD-(D/E)XK nuclease family protein, partial [Thermoguttaceae bacterium]|nr:PD-(D/E)XK nuclease family protein [Thermoguttaceae bacterium]